MNKDDLQKAIDAQIDSAKKDPKQFSKEDLAGIILTPDETKIAEKETKPKTQTEDEEAPEIRMVDLDNSEFESVKVHPEHPKTIAQMLSLEARTAQNPPKAPRTTPPGNLPGAGNVRPNIPPPGIEKIRENLKDISYVSKSESPVIKKLRTLQGDIQEAMLAGKTTLTSIVAAESNRKAATTPPPQVGISQEKIPGTGSSKTLKIIASFLGIILLAGGGFVIWYTQFKQKEPITIIETPGKNSLIIPAQFEIPINIDKRNASYIKAAVAAERKRGLGNLNEIGIIYLMETVGEEVKALNTEEFTRALEMRMPAEILRTLSANFMLGIHRFPENQTFLILETDSYDRARASMLEWESNLEEDVGKLLRSSTDFAYKNSSEATTNRRVFKDETIKNQDARVLYNDNGKILFFYTFLKDRRTIVFTTSEETLGEIISGLAAIKVVQ